MTAEIPEGAAFRVIREHVDADGTRVVDEFELFGVVRGRVDPDMPPNRLEFRDHATGQLRAVWTEHGIVEFHPPTFDPPATAATSAVDPVRNALAALRYAMNARIRWPGVR